MSDSAWNVLLNVVASVITGAAVWVGQRWIWRRRLRRRRRFLGLERGPALLVVNRHVSAGNDRSVHRADVAALVELSGLLRECGARPEVVYHDQAIAGPGEGTEFCIGGPDSNARTVAHLRWALPGLVMESFGSTGRELAVRVAGATHPRQPGVVDYAVLAKIVRPGRERPIFLVCGQTAVSNQAAVGYLVGRLPELARAHGLAGRFCLLLRVLEPGVYGPTMVELVRDVTAEAFSAPAVAGGAAAADVRGLTPP
jgi:hypothetical protein